MIRCAALFVFVCVVVPGVAGAGFTGTVSVQSPQGTRDEHDDGTTCGSPGDVPAGTVARTTRVAAEVPIAGPVTAGPFHENTSTTTHGARFETEVTGVSVQAGVGGGATVGGAVGHVVHREAGAVTGRGVSGEVFVGVPIGSLPIVLVISHRTNITSNGTSSSQRIGVQACTSGTAGNPGRGTK